MYGPFNEFDGLEGIVHLANAQEETEIQHGLNRLCVLRVDAHKFAQSSAKNQSGNASLHGQIVLVIHFDLIWGILI
jgi:hypothetical protein